ncbi:RagB/SusD family nutrient uptake outer membrane protein [Pararcticibacter amylolyticus]|uniref:RagB/SusD family nutrient uptake outer membrane protein n=1 Tax=Pararcticibacter amylolyticus TaxID=2173175 RepID=A0A2U2P9X1_9SPHI|nr:RagB/SusD family nutrient uptake outer membrane protein [Pararcticibacter amylolyticus]PWG78181.1 RagB/SusD family nutrient uptake outer membrane protein [Pararcticibacter amylolyticus]
MKAIRIIVMVLITITFSACQKYLDVIPDNVATIDYAFHLRSSALRYLYTCYSYLPEDGHPNTNSGFNAADEVWYMNPAGGFSETIWNEAKGLQNVQNPLADYWTGANAGKPYFQAIRDCNTFLENVDKVVDLDEYEKQRWTAEVKFLKAYYNFFLVRMYGPIPLIKTNMPLEASAGDVKVYREPLDTCFNYITELLDEAIANDALPDNINGLENTEQGRITRAIALAVKARVLVTAASPLFNGGSPGFFTLKDNRGRELFNTAPDPGKWQKAAGACREAIEFCEAQGYGLHKFRGAASYRINDTIKTQLDIRTAFTERDDNQEVIWANTNSRPLDIQRYSMPQILAGDRGGDGVTPKGSVAPTLKMVRQFYTDKGLPIVYDKDWSGKADDELLTAGVNDRYYVKKGQVTVRLHFNREPRFYAAVGFDRGIWFGNATNNYDVNLESGTNSALLYIQGRSGELSAAFGVSGYTVTGYQLKKLVDIRTLQIPQMPAANIYAYNWPEMRMSELYLLYAEALNEAGGYSTSVTQWVNKVRERAGIPGVEDAWDHYSTQPGFYLDKANMREIIHQERTNELAFEGQRYWDLKRWMKAHVSGNLNAPVYGWDINQKDPQTFYRPVLLFTQRFAMRDYFAPIKLSEMQINSNLVQNPGW